MFIHGLNSFSTVRFQSGGDFLISALMVIFAGKAACDVSEKAIFWMIRESSWQIVAFCTSILEAWCILLLVNAVLCSHFD